MQTTPDAVVELTGPVDLINGKLVLEIPMEAGGSELAKVSRGISEVHGAILRVELPAWLAEKLGIAAGDLVDVDNVGGKFNVRARPAA